MSTSSVIKKRALALAEKTDVNSISPQEVGGIMHDLASHSENVLRNGGTLGIRKVYESIAAMEADNTNPIDFWGNPIKKGNLVVIYDGTTTGVDNNKIYAFMNPGWELATKLDAAYATKAETDAKLSELGSKVGDVSVLFNIKSGANHSSRNDQIEINGKKGDVIEVRAEASDGDNVTSIAYWGFGKSEKSLKSTTLGSTIRIVLDDDYEYIGAYVSTVNTDKSINFSARFALSMGVEKAFDEISRLDDKCQIFAYISGGNKPSFKLGEDSIEVLLPKGNEFRIYDKEKGVIVKVGIKEQDVYSIGAYNALVLDAKNETFKVVNMVDGVHESEDIYVLLFNQYNNGVYSGLLKDYFLDYLMRWNNWYIQNGIGGSVGNIVIKQGEIVVKRGFSLINGVNRYNILGSGEYTISTLDEANNGARVIRTFVYIDTNIFKDTDTVDIDSVPLDSVFIVSDEVKDNFGYILFAVFYYKNVCGGLVNSLTDSIRENLSTINNEIYNNVYFSGNGYPTFSNAENGSLNVKFPTSGELRIYDREFNKLYTFSAAGQLYNIPDYSCIVFNKDARLIEVVRFIDGSVSSNYIVLLWKNTTGVYSGLLAPYYHKHTDDDISKSFNYDNISIQDAYNNQYNTISVEEGKIVITKGFSLFVNGVRYAIGCEEPYTISTLDEANNGARVTRTFVYIDKSKLNSSAAISLDGSNKQDVFVIKANTDNNKNYILFATFYYKTASGGLIDVYRNIEKNGVIELYQDKENERNQCRFRSDFNCLMFSDIHASATNMNRIVELANSWGEGYIHAVLNGGDTAANQVTDGYEWYNSAVDNTNIDVLTAPGNHDEWIGSNWNWANSTEVYNAIIAPVVSKVQNIIQPSNAVTGGKLYYYKDYNNKVRVIVLETTISGSTVPYWNNEQSIWMQNVLEDAREKNLGVICLCHAPLAKDDGSIDESISFNSWTGYRVQISDGKSNITHDSISTIDAALANIDTFINNGGKFICWLAGHTHLDYFVKSISHPRQVMFVTDSAKYNNSRDCATTSDESNPMYDCINYIGIDLDKMWLKILRIGKNIDGFMRKKNVLVYDLTNQKVITNY